MKPSSLLLTLLAVLAMLGSSCDSVSSTAPISSANSSSQVMLQGEVDGQEDIQEFDLDNCDGKAEAIRVEHRLSSIDVTVSTELVARIGVNAEVISAEVQTTVGAALRIGGERGTSIELKAPPNTHMFFQLAWIGKSQIGVVQDVRGSGIPVAFQSFTPNNVRIKSQYDIGCRSSAPPSTTQPQQDTLLKGKYPCPLLVDQGQVESWKIGQASVTAVDQAIKDFDALRPNDEGAFVKGTQVPSGVLVATNFDERDANKWTQYPVIPIIHSGSWGLFQTTGDYTTPNAGACMTIVP